MYYFIIYLRLLSKLHAPRNGADNYVFGKLEDDISYVYSSNNFSVFQPDERAFAQKVIATIPPSSLIINTPNDGSGFMYALYGANIYYRNFQYGGTSETWESQIIRTKLNEYATNPEVQKAVRAIDAKYVLVMNQDPQNSYRPTSLSTIQKSGSELNPLTITLRDSRLCSQMGV